jgi:hypothetical protein
MGKVMNASDFVAKLKDIATNYKTLYVMGCFGAPMTAANKKRYIEHHPYNKQAARVKLINAASADTFGFDCVCLIKGVLWGWNGDKNKVYGGAKYATNGVPDVDANVMIKLCSDVSTDFSKIEVGEAVWTEGHIGVYIGDGLAVECTPAWKNRVQITACNIAKSGYNTRKWKKHGKLPYINYDVVTKTESKLDVAKEFNKSVAGKYKVTASAGLNIRTGANSKKTSLGVLKKDSVVTNYGYYNVASNGVKWLYVVTSDGITGYCSSKYLKKC